MYRTARNLTLHAAWVLMLCAFPGLGSSSATLAAAPDTEVTVIQCEVTLDPGVVRPGDRPVTVVARLSEEVGQIGEVSVENRSGIGVAEVEQVDLPVVRLTLDTSEAQEGAWQVTLTGEGGQCTGRLRVESPGR